MPSRRRRTRRLFIGRRVRRSGAGRGDCDWNAFDFQTAQRCVFTASELRNELVRSPRCYTYVESVLTDYSPAK